jgi:hypothetical protein
VGASVVSHSTARVCPHPQCILLNDHGALVRGCRVLAPVSAPPHSLAAPPAGLVCLTTAAAPSASPQLLNPGVSLGLAEAAALSAQIAGQLAGMSTTERAEGLKKAVVQGLKRFDEQQGPEVGAHSTAWACCSAKHAWQYACLVFY